MSVLSRTLQLLKKKATGKTKPKTNDLVEDRKRKILRQHFVGDVPLRTLLRKAHEWRKKWHNVQTPKIEQTGTKNGLFFVKASTKSADRLSTEVYVQTMIISHVKETDRYDAAYRKVSVQGSSKSHVYMKPIDPSMAAVKLRCTCKDFQYRFMWADDKDVNSLLGSPIPYVRKTTTRPPANPHPQKWGTCKHLNALVLDLMKRRYIMSDSITKKATSKSKRGFK